MAAWAMASLPFINLTSSSIFQEVLQGIKRLIASVYDAIHFYAGVWAHRGAGRATYTSLRLGREGEVIAAVIDLLGLEEEHVARTCHHTEVATLAALTVDSYSTIYFCHNHWFLGFSSANVTKSFDSASLSAVFSAEDSTYSSFSAQPGAKSPHYSTPGPRISAGPRCHYHYQSLHFYQLRGRHFMASRVPGRDLSKLYSEKSPAINGSR